MQYERYYPLDDGNKRACDIHWPWKISSLRQRLTFIRPVMTAKLEKRGINKKQGMKRGNSSRWIFSPSSLPLWWMMKGELEAAPFPTSILLYSYAAFRSGTQPLKHDKTTGGWLINTPRRNRAFWQEWNRGILEVSVLCIIQQWSGHSTCPLSL